MEARWSWLPNILTFTRIALVPVIVVALIGQRMWTAAGLFTAAVLTDFFDGYCARRLGVCSSWGIFCDPLADKFLVHTLLIVFWQRGLLSLVPVAIMIARDVFVSFLRLFAGIRSCPVQASLLGKLKVVMQVVLIYAVFSWLLIGKAGEPPLLLFNALAWSAAIMAIFAACYYVGIAGLKVKSFSHLEFFAWFFATGFGSGFFPLFPGSLASLLAALAWYGLPILPCWVDLAVVICLAAIGVPVSNYVSRALGKQDPSCVVIDEFLGMWIALVCVPKLPLCAALAFVLFRFFDVVKPFPVARAERLHGGWGIMLDDVLAGAFARIVLASCGI